MTDKEYLASLKDKNLPKMSRRLLKIRKKLEFGLDGELTHLVVTVDKQTKG